jgi:hypothetical protein
MSSHAARRRTQAAGLAAKPAVRIAAIAVAAGAALAGFVAAFLVSTHEAPSVLLEQPVTIKRALSTTAALFGDGIEAEVDVYTDDRSVDPESVRIRTSFAPYRAAQTRVDRERRGGVSLLQTRIVLTCLTQACVPPRASGRAFRFPPLTVTYRTGSRTESVAVPWERVHVVSRLPLDSTASLGVVDTAPPLDSGFPRSPTLQRALLIGAATVLGLVGAILVATGLWPRLASAGYRRRKLSPLERVLVEVEASAQLADETQRRRVLDLLASRLAELPSPSLEARTRSLAWGEATPEPELVTRLAAQVRTSLNGGTRR